MQLVTDVIEKLSTESEAHRDEASEAIRTKMLAVLAEMIQDSGGFIGATVSSVDGLAWAEKIADGFDKHRFAAMSSSLLAISDELAGEMGCGPTNNLLIEGVGGKDWAIRMVEQGPFLPSLMPHWEWHWHKQNAPLIRWRQFRCSC